ncbi:MAG: tetratricopeptide repeat protein [Chitinophagales bacterium]|nr:tetratricopeptide repeat protein [Chitinophagales bacterium]MDW8419298.1 adenylate/guanylate cyclase domain-containing protein [Chitinophagales bacterium]
MKGGVLWLIFLFIATVAHSENPETLLTGAAAALNNNPRQALQDATAARDAARQSGNKKQEALATAIMGVANYKIDNQEEALSLITQAITLSDEIKDTSTAAFSRYWFGNMALQLGQQAQALEYFHIACELAGAIGDKKNIARCLDGKATLYETQKQYDKALEYYKQSYDIARQISFKEWYAPVTFSIANVYSLQGKTEQAIAGLEESIRLSEETNNLNNKAACYQALATIYYAQNNLPKAFEYIRQAMDLFSQTGAQTSFSYARILMSYIMMKEKQWDLAIGTATESLRAGANDKDTKLQKDAAEALYNIYKYKGDEAMALRYLEQARALSETSFSEDLAKKLTQIEIQSKYERELATAEIRRKAREAELNAQIEQQKIVKKASLIGILLLSLIAALAVFAFIQKRNDNRIIAAEKKKSDELLLNILPAEVAQELKEKGISQAKNFENATVLFADIKNTSGAAERLPPEQLVSAIDYYFKKFDEIVTAHKIEKIKTIGDAYLCVGGLSASDSENANNVVSAAWEMMKFVLNEKEKRLAEGNIYFDMRIGIHSGKLVAGIVGLRKFSYDIWGDTVNIATRMEQHGEDGKINISGATYELVKDKFRCVMHGKIASDNKTEIDMYFVEGPA